MAIAPYQLPTDYESESHKDRLTQVDEALSLPQAVLPTEPKPPNNHGAAFLPIDPGDRTAA